MKVYFSSSLRAKKIYQKNFEKIYECIKSLKYKHTSDFLLKADPEEYYHRQTGDFSRFYKTLTSQIKKADICVFEVSLHSLGIGYCVDLALQMNKPVVLLYLKEKNPTFFKGIKSDKMQLYEYDLEKINEVIKDALEAAREMVDIRFTFFINPKIVRFLDWVAKSKKTPRAVYLRGLIENAIKKENFK